MYVYAIYIHMHMHIYTYTHRHLCYECMYICTFWHVRFVSVRTMKGIIIIVYSFQCLGTWKIHFVHFLLGGSYEWWNRPGCIRWHCGTSAERRSAHLCLDVICVCFVQCRSVTTFSDRVNRNKKIHRNRHRQRHSHRHRDLDTGTDQTNALTWGNGVGCSLQISQHSSEINGSGNNVQIIYTSLQTRQRTKL